MAMTQLKNEFKVGDKVIFLIGNSWGFYKVGHVYTIKEKSQFFEQYYTYEHPTASLRTTNSVLLEVYNSPLYQALT